MALCMGGLLKVFQCVERADDAVFVKAKSPVGTAKIAAIHAVDLTLARLRRHARRRVQRVMIGDALDDLARGDVRRAVERDTKRVA